MPIRPELSLQVQQPQQPDVLGSYGRVLTLADMVQGNQFRREQMEQQAEQTRIENERLRAAAEQQQRLQGIMGKFDPKAPEATVEALMRGGFGDHASKLQGTIDTHRKTVSEAENKAFEKAQKQMEALGNAFYALDNLPEDRRPGAYKILMGGLRQMGAIGNDLQAPEEYDPAWVEAQRTGYLDVKTQVDEWAKKREEQRAAALAPFQLQKAKADAKHAADVAAGKAPIQPAEQARIDQGTAQFAETKRHNRVLEAKGNDKERIVQIAGPSGEAIWVRESEAVGKPAAQAARSITGQERQALAFYNRMRQAAENIEAVEDKVAKAGLLKQASLKLPDILQGEEAQQYTQAQRAFTEARLRKESGAAIPDHEYKNDARTYFAQPGNTPAQIEQKRRARQAVMEGVANSAGKAYDEWYGEPLRKPANSGGGEEEWVRDKSGKLVRK